jgi:hypothetical protein
MPQWSKLPSSGHRCLTPFSSKLGYKLWCHSWDKCLNVNDDYVRVSCLSSAIHFLVCIKVRKNKVLSIRVFPASILTLSLYIYIPTTAYIRPFSGFITHRAWPLLWMLK